MIDFVENKTVCTETELLDALTPKVHEIAEKFDFRTQFTTPEVNLELIAEKVETVAKAFLALGLDAGNKIGVYDASITEWSVLFGACQKMGLELVHVGREYSSEETIAWLAKNNCKALFASKNAQLYLKGLIAAFDAQVIPFFPVNHIVLLNESEALKEDNVLSFSEFELLAQFTSDRELNKFSVAKAA